MSTSLTARLLKKRRALPFPRAPACRFFSPDGKYGYVCSSFNPETEVISVADHKFVGKVTQGSPFCPDLAATPASDSFHISNRHLGRTKKKRQREKQDKAIRTARQQADHDQTNPQERAGEAGDAARAETVDGKPRHGPAERQQYLPIQHGRTDSRPGPSRFCDDRFDENPEAEE